MANLTIPVEQASRCVVLGIESKTDGQGDQTRDKDTGMPQWFVHIDMRPTEQERPEVLRVVIASTNRPTLERDKPVRFTNLRAMHWQMDGRSGLSFKADTAEQGSAPRKPAGGES